MHESVNIDAIHTMLVLTFCLSTKVESGIFLLISLCLHIFSFSYAKDLPEIKGFSLRKGIINNTWFIDKMFVFVVILKAR